MGYGHNVSSCHPLTYLTAVFVHTMYSTSSVYGFWKLKQLVLSQHHSRFLAWKRYIRDNTWPFSFTAVKNWKGKCKPSTSCEIGDKTEMDISEAKLIMDISAAKNGWSFPPLCQCHWYYVYSKGGMKLANYIAVQLLARQVFEHWTKLLWAASIF